MTAPKNLKTASTHIADDPRWTRIVTRDRSADGEFWYSVVTTGVYCRPSCPSRTANPKNVQLHDTLERARATGFRPCRRCNPDGLSIHAENVDLVANLFFKDTATNEISTLSLHDAGDLRTKL